MLRQSFQISGPMLLKKMPNKYEILLLSTFIEEKLKEALYSLLTRRAAGAKVGDRGCEGGVQDDPRWI